VRSAWALATAVIRGSLRDRRWALVSLLTPLSVLLLFWVGLRERPALLPVVFPAVVSLAVMLTGSAEATRLVSWRERGVLARLVCTPLTLPEILLVGSSAQALLGLAQAALLLLVGASLLALPLPGVAPAGILVALALGSACFAAYALLVAQAVNRAESANALFIFSVLPMYFLGGAIPASQLPEALRLLGGGLPPGLVAHAVERFLAGAPEQGVLPLLGLTGYTGLFACLAARFFRIS
jgi:ABC-2 type transport system permease protein